MVLASDSDLVAAVDHARLAGWKVYLGFHSRVRKSEVENLVTGVAHRFLYHLERQFCHFDSGCSSSFQR